MYSLFLFGLIKKATLGFPHLLPATLVLPGCHLGHNPQLFFLSLSFTFFSFSLFWAFGFLLSSRGVRNLKFSFL